jgi:hypothetical protein
MSDRRNAGLPYTYSLGGGSDSGHTSAKVQAPDVSPVRSATSKTSSSPKASSQGSGSKASTKTHAPRPSLAPSGSDRSIHTWRSGISKASPPAGAPKPAFTSMPPLLAEELDIQSRRTAAVPAPCHVTIFPPGPHKAHATKLAPPKIVMRTSTGQTAGPRSSSSHGAGAGQGTGFPPFPPFPIFPAFPSFPPFPAFPAWPTYPAPQAHGR